MSSDQQREPVDRPHAAPIFGRDRSFNAVVNGPHGKLVIDGVDVSQGIRGFRLAAAQHEWPRLELDLAVFTHGVVAADQAEVVMPAETERLLRRAGWRPPGDWEALRAAADKLIADLRRIAGSARDSAAATAPECTSDLIARAHRADALELAASMAEQDLGRTACAPDKEK